LNGIVINVVEGRQIPPESPMIFGLIVDVFIVTDKLRTAVRNRICSGQSGFSCRLLEVRFPSLSANGLQLTTSYYALLNSFSKTGN